jgi:hypothetical protein
VNRRLRRVEQMLSPPSPDARQAKVERAETRRRAFREIELETMGYETPHAAFDAGEVSEAELRWLTTSEIRHAYAFD